ncbi:MAG: PAS domain-containing protein [Rhizobacter sp.]|nr:PAS domain-containing protein [Rhizobacter sp.]
MSALLVIHAAQDENAASETQARAQTASHQVSGLLVLTQEYARHSEGRAAQQWHQRQATIATALVGEDTSAALKELRSVTQAMPALFTRLEELPLDETPFTLRRKEVLIDQLLTSTQAMSDLAYQWYQEAAQRRRTAEHRFQTLALVTPLTMMVLLIGVAGIVRQRVLAPLKNLTHATGAVSRGDLGVRVAVDNRDEFGELSRRFDQMTQALARSDEQFRRSEKQLKAVTDNLPVLIAYVDRNQVYRFVNAHFKNVFGAEPETFLGKTLAEVLGPKAYAERKREVDGVLQGERRTFERHLTEHGQDAHQLVDYLPDRDSTGAIDGFYMLVIDITARKKAELAQARSERLLRMIADNLPTLIAYIDPDEKFRFVNAHYKQLLSIETDSLLGGTVEAALGPANYPLVKQHRAAALAGQRQHFERVALIADHAIHLMTDYIPDIGEDGKVIGIFAMAVDVTALKQAELLQAQSEQRVRSILKHAPDAFISIDSQSRIREWNRQAELTFGWAKDEVLGRPLAETLIPAEHRDGHNTGMKRFAVTGEGPVVNQRIEITALHKDGHIIPVELSIAAVNEGSGYAATAFLRDISERKLAEKLLHDSEKRLRDITDNIPAMVGYFDADERCIYANATVLKVHNIDKKDMQLHTLRSGVGEESYAIHEPHVRRVLQGEFARFEGHAKRNGRDAYFQAHLVPDKTEGGEVRGFYVMSFDVTAVRQAEQQRARSEQQLRQITDNLPVLISYIDKDLRLRFANETYRTWLGADPRSLLGEHVRDVVGAALYEPRRQYLERALNGERVEFENEAVALGVTRTTHTTYIPDLEQDGSVQGIYTLSSDVTALKNVERQLQALARFDTLTGLPNRLQFNEKLPEVLARASRTGTAVALMYLDVDHFKAINDTLGHAAGDAVLREFAARLVASVRATDIVARLAGDEFAIILEGLHQRSEVQAVAQKIVDQVGLPMHAADQELSITTSVGIAFHDITLAATTPESLLGKADEALYAAKAAGRSTFRMAPLAAEAEPLL